MDTLWSVPSPSMSLTAGAPFDSASMPSKGFALAVLRANTGTVDVPVFSM